MPSDQPKPEPAPRMTDCLLVQRGSHAAQVGQRIPLIAPVMHAGRATGNEILLDDHTVSRHHARFELRAGVWYVVDNSSTNGTYCNDVQIRPERALRSGDRVKIGTTILLLLTGPEMERRYRDELRKMLVTDALTQAHNAHYLIEASEREIESARASRQSLALMVFDIDRFRRINEAHGELAGDFALRGLARLIQPRIRGDEVFARLDGDDFAVLLPDTSLAKASAFAESLREELRRTAFEFQKVDIRLTISAGLTVLQEGDRAPADLLDRARHEMETAKRGGGDRIAGGLLPERTAAKGASPSIDKSSARAAPSPLLQRVLARRAAENLATAPDLPFPLAALGPAVLSKATPSGRVEALLDGIEAALRFMVAVELGALRHGADAALCDKAAAMIARREHLGGAWEDLAPGLASLFPNTPGDPLSIAMQELASATVDGGSLVTALGRISALRGAIQRATGLGPSAELPDDSFAGEEAALRRILGGILFAVRSLGQLRLVSVAEILDFEEEDMPRYALRLHRGPKEEFASLTESLPHRLQKGVCYLLSEDKKSAPVSLSPIVLARHCETCRRVEVVIADDLVLGPKGTHVRVRAVGSRHEATVEIPWQKRAGALFIAVSTASAREAYASLGPREDPERRETFAPPRPAPRALGGEAEAEPAPSSRAPASEGPRSQGRRRLKLFCCYATSDEPEFNRLAMHLKLLQRQGLIEPWRIRSAPAVGTPSGDLDEPLDQADAVILLLSPSFVEADYCHDEELLRALRRKDSGQTLVLPVLLRDCDFGEGPFRELATLPRHGPAVTRWPDRDQAWSEIVKELRRMLADHRAASTSAS